LERKSCLVPTVISISEVPSGDQRKGMMAVTVC